MTDWFVTRHAGAKDWAARRGLSARIVAHLEIGSVEPGDRVIGALPVHLAAEVCRRGARYVHLTLDLPERLRGVELSADDMDACGARLEEFQVISKGAFE